MRTVLIFAHGCAPYNRCNPSDDAYLSTRNIGRSITALGEKATVKVGGTALNRSEHSDFAQYDDGDRKALRVAPKSLFVYGAGHPLHYENVVRLLRGETAPGTDGREGRNSLEPILGIDESARTGREVPLPLRTLTQEPRTA